MSELQHVDLIAPGDPPVVVTLRHAQPPTFTENFDAQLVRPPFGTALHLAGSKQLEAQTLLLSGTVTAATQTASDDLLEALHQHATAFTRVRLGKRLVPIAGITGAIASAPTLRGYRVTLEVLVTDGEWAAVEPSP